MTRKCHNPECATDLAGCHKLRKYCSGPCHTKANREVRLKAKRNWRKRNGEAERIKRNQYNAANRGEVNRKAREAYRKRKEKQNEKLG